ncbi:hypothetical protein BBJ29_002928 [Phytophthora kernoviae]|uniref:PX domain-containing protein n=1 Tax=Phytophthora kernoviae TaxID=325452 RepID=A0A3F2S574_9STRA|nr:hypothetical protein BBJ29_002928 [Phytophthora kernoviae]RLN69736.1 hypothetical protein BBP00_00000203 [Phytophthora kernoviae]
MGSQESLDLDCGKFYTEYILRCSWIERNGTPEIWDVVRRYREFCAIDILLREKYPARAQMFPYLPSKKYIGSSLSAEFVDKRQRDLGYYVMSILHSCPLVRNHASYDCTVWYYLTVFSLLLCSLYKTRSLTRS